MDNEHLTPGEKQRIGLEILRKANIPFGHQPKRVEEYCQHQGWEKNFTLAWGALDRKRVAGEFGSLVVLCGPRGCGKTAMAVELIRAGARRLQYGYFSALQNFLRRSRENESVQFQEDFLDPRVLVLDEVGKIGDSGWEERQFFWLVNDRYQENKHTVMTCACAPADLETLLPPSIRDRLHSKHSAVLHCNWESFR